MVEFCLSFADSALCLLEVYKEMRAHEPTLLDGVLCLMGVAFSVGLRSPIVDRQHQKRDRCHLDTLHVKLSRASCCREKN